MTRQVTDLMRAEGWRCMRLQSGIFVSEGRVVRVGQTGQPDWLFLRASPKMSIPCGFIRVVFVEIKAPGKKPSPKQRAWLNEATDAGFLATWTDDIDKFRAWLRLHGLTRA